MFIYNVCISLLSIFYFLFFNSLSLLIAFNFKSFKLQLSFVARAWSKCFSEHFWGKKSHRSQKSNWSTKKNKKNQEDCNKSGGNRSTALNNNKRIVYEQFPVFVIIYACYLTRIELTLREFYSKQLSLLSHFNPQIRRVRVRNFSTPPKC